MSSVVAVLLHESFIRSPGKRLPRKWTWRTDLLVMTDKWSRAQLERSLTQRSNVELMLDIDATASDETPRNVFVQQSGVHVTDDDLLASKVTQEHGRWTGLDLLDGSGVKSRFKETTVAKICKTNSIIACLVLLGTKMLCVRAPTLNWLQVIYWTNGEVVHRGLSWTAAMSLAAEA